MVLFCAFGRSEPGEELSRFPIPSHTPRSCSRARESSARDGSR